VNNLNVYFSSFGDQPLAGTLHLPEESDTGRPRPGVVLAHGMANNRDEAGQHDFLARHLKAAGYVVLSFDFHGCGESGRRGRMFIGSEWPQDLQAAITYLQQRAEVDANRIAAVGSSWAGGVTIYAAAADRRIRCAVSLGAPANGERWLRDQWTAVFGEEGWQAFLAQVDADRVRVAAGELSRTVRLIGGFIPVPADQIPFYDNFLAEHTAIVSDIPLEIAPDILSFAPETVVKHVSPTPLLIVHGTADPVVDCHHAEAYYERADEPKKLCLIEGGVHQVLSGETAEETIGIVLSWLGQNL